MKSMSTLSPSVILLTFALIGPLVSPASGETICPECRPIRSPIRLTLAELQGQGDLNGDGIADLAIVDRKTGVLRIGYGEASGGYEWARPISIGARDLNTGMAIGFLRPGAAESVALTSPSFNRLQVIHPGEDTPKAVVTVGVGPAALVALPDGTNTWDELYVTSRWNNQPEPFQIELKHGTNLTHAGIRATVDARLPRHLAAVPLAKDLPPSLALLLEDANGMASRLQIHVIDAGTPANRLPNDASPIAELTGLPRENRFDFGFFQGSTQPVFILRDGTAGVLRLYTLNSSNQFSAARFWNPGAAVNSSGLQDVAVIRGGKEVFDRIVVSFQSGPVALAIYSYNITTDQFTLLTSISRSSLPQYMAFTGLMTLGVEGDFVLLTGEMNGVTTAAHQFTPDGTFQFTSVMPALTPLIARANVFLYDVDPATNRNARLVGTRSISDWTTDIFGFPTNLVVAAQLFGSTEQGLLKDPARYELGPAPAGVGAVQANQADLPVAFANAVSVSSLSGAAGELVQTATPIPGAGRFIGAVRIEFQVPDQHFVFYRTQQGFFGTPTEWLAYNASVPIFILQSSTVQWYSQRAAGGLRSPVGSAYYEIETTADSDGDGVPDNVETHFGLDPTAGWDSDGDGVSDLIEILRGTDPANALNFPTDGLLALPSRTAYIITADARVPDYDPTGTSADASYPTMVRLVQSNTVISARRIGGGLITDAPVVSGEAVLENVPVDSDFPMVLVGTPVSYSLVGSGSAIRDYGREMIALVTEPPVESINLPDAQNYASMQPAAAAAAWISAMTNLLAQANFAAPATTSVRLDPDTTLAALVVERRAGELLGVAKPTLFASRLGEKNRTPITAADFAALKYPTSPQAPSVDLLALYEEVLETIQTSAAPDMVSLRALASLIYAESMNPAAVGEAGLIPIDALRGLIAGDDLPTFYSALPGDEAARLAVAQLLNIDAERSPVVVQLAIGFMSTFSGTCTILERPGESERGVTLNLYDAFGAGPYRFPPDFPRVNGTIVEVTGYPFTPAGFGCWGDTSIAVANVRLIELPLSVAISGGDTLMASSWEREFLGSVGNDPFTIIEIDGKEYQLLQLYLDGADPLTGAGATEPEDLRPEIQIEMGPDGTLKVFVEYPSRYAAVIRLVREDSDDLTDNFNWRITSIAVLQPDGTLETEVELNEEEAAQFFRYRLELNN